MMSLKKESYQQRKARMVTERGLKSVHRTNIYLIKKLLGHPIGHDLAQQLDDAFRASTGYYKFIGNILITLLREAPASIEILGQRNGLTLMTKLLCAGVDTHISGQFSQPELAEMQAQIKQQAAFLENQLRDMEGNGKPSLGEELEVNAETAVREGWRIRSGIPPKYLNLGDRERHNLENALGMRLSDRGNGGSPDQYGQTILPILLHVIAKPGEAKTGAPPADSPLWKWAGIRKPTRDCSGKLDDLFNGVVQLFSHMATLEGRRDVVGYLIARQIRQEYGVGKGRNVDTFSTIEEDRSRRAAQSGATGDMEPWEPEDINGARGYEDVELRMMWEAVYQAAPPAQREALDLYREAEASGRPLAEICKQYGKDPNLTRNNFQALKKAVRKRVDLNK